MSIARSLLQEVTRDHRRSGREPSCACDRRSARVRKGRRRFAPGGLQQRLV